MGWFVLILLLLAAALGVLGAVVKVAVVLVLSAIIAVAILVWGTWWYLRYRMHRFAREVQAEADRRARRERAYPVDGGTGRPDTGRGIPPELPE